MPRIAVCEGDFYRDWFGSLKCNGNQWNVDEHHLYTQTDLEPINERIDNLDQLNSYLESRIANVEGTVVGTSDFQIELSTEQYDSIWLLVFCTSLIVVFGLGAIKGAQR
jgi:hypothetical protein